MPYPLTVDAVSEYYMVRVAFTNAKTVGPGSCAGCADGVCIVLNMVRLDLAPATSGSYTITNPLNSQFVVWQAGGYDVGPGPSKFGGITGCPGATPARNRTWGSLKALYR